MTQIKALDDGRLLVLTDDLVLQVHDSNGPVTDGFNKRDYMTTVAEWVAASSPSSPERLLGLRYMHKEKAIDGNLFVSLGNIWFARNS